MAGSAASGPYRPATTMATGDRRDPRSLFSDPPAPLRGRSRRRRMVTHPLRRAKFALVVGPEYAELEGLPTGGLVNEKGT